MTFNILLGVSVSICLIGLILRFIPWFTQGIRPEGQQISLSERLSEAMKGLFSVIFSGKLLAVIKSFFLDQILQQRVYSKSWLRWTAHTLIFFGFLLLFFLHALDSVVTENLFSGYVSTLNPYLFLRNLFGLMVLAGVAIAVYRRAPEDLCQRLGSPDLCRYHYSFGHAARRG